MESDRNKRENNVTVNPPKPHRYFPFFAAFAGLSMFDILLLFTIAMSKMDWLSTLPTEYGRGDIIEIFILCSIPAFIGLIILIRKILLLYRQKQSPLIYLFYLATAFGGIFSGIAAGILFITSLSIT